jgi:hypothetical protein
MHLGGAVAIMIIRVAQDCCALRMEVCHALPQVECREYFRGSWSSLGRKGTDSLCGGSVETTSITFNEKAGSGAGTITEFWQGNGRMDTYPSSEGTHVSLDISLVFLAFHQSRMGLQCILKKACIIVGGNRKKVSQNASIVPFKGNKLGD